MVESAHVVDEIFLALPLARRLVQITVLCNASAQIQTHTQRAPCRMASESSVICSARPCPCPILCWACACGETLRAARACNLQEPHVRRSRNDGQIGSSRVRTHERQRPSSRISGCRHPHQSPCEEHAGRCAVIIVMDSWYRRIAYTLRSGLGQNSPGLSGHRLETNQCRGTVSQRRRVPCWAPVDGNRSAAGGYLVLEHALEVRHFLRLRRHGPRPVSPQIAGRRSGAEPRASWDAGGFAKKSVMAVSLRFWTFPRWQQCLTVHARLSDASRSSSFTQ